MADQKEYVKINFKGQEISINRVWGGHRFSDAEVKRLEKGETIHIKAKKANGDDFECDGNVQKQEYNGFKFWGFKMIPFKPKEKAEGTFAGIQIKFNRVWGEHRFSDDEVQKLLAGETIHITGKKKNGDSFECDGKLTEQEYEGRKFWGFKNVESKKDSGGDSFDQAVDTLKNDGTIAESDNTETNLGAETNNSSNDNLESQFDEDDLF